MQYYLNRFDFKFHFPVHYLGFLPFSCFAIEKLGNPLIPSFHISKRFIPAKITAGGQHIYLVQI